jgi:hypothetical protein
MKSVHVVMLLSLAVVTTNARTYYDAVAGEYKLELTFTSYMITSFTARFNIHKFYVLPTQCIYVFCVDLRTNSDYFPIQH